MVGIEQSHATTEKGTKPIVDQLMPNIYSKHAHLQKYLPFKNMNIIFLKINISLFRVLFHDFMYQKNYFSKKDSTIKTYSGNNCFQNLKLSKEYH